MKAIIKNPKGWRRVYPHEILRNGDLYLQDLKTWEPLTQSVGLKNITGMTVIRKTKKQFNIGAWIDAHADDDD